MATLEKISLVASLVCLAVALIFTLVASVTTTRTRIARKKGAAGAAPVRSGTQTAGTIIAIIGLALITLAIISRVIQTGHGPFSNMYEFAIAFAWGVVVMGFFFQWRYRTTAVRNVGLFIAVLLLGFANAVPAKPSPLVPALQQSALLSAHVAAAVVAYGTLTIGFGAAILFLVQNRRNSPWMPEANVLDNISYQSVVIGFPFLTLLIILGALWADVAWGRYWGWDPKETASLVTWLMYAAYLHARVMRGWRGTRTAVLLIIGFAAILLTFFGNYIFTGLHAYG